MSVLVKRGLVVVGFVAVVGFLMPLFLEDAPDARTDFTISDRPPVQVMNWFLRLLEQRLPMNSQDFGVVLQAAEPYFTVDGYRDYVGILQQARAIDYLRSTNATVSFTLTEAPDYVAFGVLDGLYSWQLEHNTELKIEFEANSITYPVRLQVDISRSPDPDAFRGMKVRGIRIMSQQEASSNSG